MKETYYQLELKELKSLTEKKKLLLHSCCAPCSSHVISFLTKYFDITMDSFEEVLNSIKVYSGEKM